MLFHVLVKELKWQCQTAHVYAERVFSFQRRWEVWWIWIRGSLKAGIQVDIANNLVCKFNFFFLN